MLEEVPLGGPSRGKTGTRGTDGSPGLPQELGEAPRSRDSTLALVGLPVSLGWGQQGLTVRVRRRAPAAQAHDHRCEGQLALHAVFADAVQDVGGEMDVQIAEENDAAGILEVEVMGTPESPPLLP